jgi:hypothetical protein
MTSPDTPLAAITRGLVAGAIGTAFMTVAQELSAKLMAAGDDGDEQPEQQAQASEAEPQDPWEQASVPARLAKRIIEGVFEQEVPPQRIGLLTHAMHWGYGTAWGAAYGVLQGSRPGRSVRQGVLFGSGVWALSYVELVPTGLYEPPWKYAPKDIAMELGYHVVYGVGVVAGHRLLDRG